jgi:hypothetical protein
VVRSLTEGNPNLKPERNKEVELGADFGFLDQRVDLGVTWFDRRSEDVILFVPTNASETGYQRRLVNGASIRNKGVEITLNARPFATPSSAWEVGVNFGRLRGRVNSLLGAQFIPYNNEGFTGSIGTSSVGYAPGVIRGSDFARCGRGLVINGVDIDAQCGAGAKKDALYLADNGQPIYDPTDRVIADPNPRWNMGVNSTLRLFGNLRLSGLVDVRAAARCGTGRAARCSASARTATPRSRRHGHLRQGLLHARVPGRRRARRGEAGRQHAGRVADLVHDQGRQRQPRAGAVRPRTPAS